MIRKLLLGILLLTVVAAATMFFALHTDYSGFEKEAFIVVPPRTSTRQMAKQLAAAGVIRNEWSFLLARATQPNAVLQAGEYRFERPYSTMEVIFKIIHGDVFFYELRIPEGSNMFDIALAAEGLGLFKKEEFLKVARDPSQVRDLAPGAETLEGFLFPSTYRLTRSSTPAQLARQMTQTFRQVWSELGGTAKDVNRVVTLASLVEKETAVPSERPRVASVYQNRLDVGMKLDCDPTTIYAALLQGRYRGTIYRSDLESTHPYNTYRHAGLPPGPIANPGRSSLAAALSPARSEYLYFVAEANGTGAHIFSRTLAEHNAAVQRYRAAVR